MSSKSSAMVKFVLGLVLLSPVGLICGFLGVAWLWEYLSGCFFSMSYYCGQGDAFKAAIFLTIAGASFTGIQKLWAKTK